MVMPGVHSAAGAGSVERELRGLRQPGHISSVISPLGAGNLPLSSAASEIYLDEKIENYIVDLIFATRYPKKYGLGELESYINFGASPRGSISLAKAAKCYAFIQGRGFVIPEDVRAIIKDVLRHRIGLTYEAEADLVTSETIIEKIVSTIQVP